MPNRLITYERAKREIERLQTYIDLVDNYKVDSLEKWIVKQYAVTNSIRKIIEIAEAEEVTKNGVALDREYITSIINGKVEKGDELHRILRLGYRQKIRPNKRKKR